jgi:hypothetical protein
MTKRHRPWGTLVVLMAALSTHAAAQTAGGFTTLTYNVAGLLEPFSGGNPAVNTVARRVPDGRRPARGTEDRGRRLPRGRGVAVGSRDTRRHVRFNEAPRARRRRRHRAAPVR